MRELTLIQRLILQALVACKEPATPALVQWHQPKGLQMPPSAIEKHLIGLEKKGAATRSTRSDRVEVWSPVQGEKK